jgi:hypothetical protein
LPPPNHLEKLPLDFCLGVVILETDHCTSIGFAVDGANRLLPHGPLEEFQSRCNPKCCSMSG